mgnify:CR=1 FL=1
MEQAASMESPTRAFCASPSVRQALSQLSRSLPSEAISDEARLSFAKHRSRWVSKLCFSAVERACASARASRRATTLASSSYLTMNSASAASSFV